VPDAQEAQRGRGGRRVSEHVMTDMAATVSGLTSELAGKNAAIRALEVRRAGAMQAHRRSMCSVLTVRSLGRAVPGATGCGLIEKGAAYGSVQGRVEDLEQAQSRATRLVTADMADLRQRAEAAEAEVEDLRARLEAAEAALRVAQARSEAAQERLVEAEAEAREAEQRALSIEAELRGQLLVAGSADAAALTAERARAVELGEAAALLRREADDARVRLVGLEADRATLEAELAAARSRAAELEGELRVREASSLSPQFQCLPRGA
jgi:hypothetical protein